MSSTPPNDQFRLVGTRLDDYDVERVVAAGGFGIVYFARHHALGRSVAIKVLKVPDSLQGDGRATFLKLFLDEAKTIASLEHPAIVGVLGYRVSPMPAGGDAPWMALEWVEGETLAAQLARRRGQGGREPRECLRLLEPVFDALAVAHAKGIAHRDIKPASVAVVALARDPKTIHSCEADYSVCCA